MSDNELNEIIDNIDETKEDMIILSKNYDSVNKANPDFEPKIYDSYEEMIRRLKDDVKNLKKVKKQQKKLLKLEEKRKEVLDDIERKRQIEEKLNERDRKRHRKH